MVNRKYGKRAAVPAGGADGSPFATVIKFLISAVTVVFVLVVLTLGGIAAYNQIQAGRGATVVAHGEVAAEEVGFPIFQRVLGEEAYRAIFRPQVTYGFQSDIQRSNDAEAGIKNIKLEQIGRPRFEEPIQVTGTFTAASPLQDLELVVECELDDDVNDPVKGVVEVSATAASGNKAIVFEGTQETIRARCVFPEGLSPEGDVEFVTGLTTTESGTPLEVPGKVTMFIRYEYYSKAGYNTYMLSREVASELLSNNRDPFEFYGVEDPQLNRGDRTIRSVTIPGPLNLGIGSFTSQPFVENTPYDISVTMRNNPGVWKGELKKLEGLELRIPPYFRLESDSDYSSQLQTQIVCPFTYVREDNEGFRVYELNPEELDRVNKDCAQETLESTDITEKECLDIFGKDRDIPFNCNFKHEREYESMRQDFIHADARYIYQTKSTAVVKAVTNLV